MYYRFGESEIPRKSSVRKESSKSRFRNFSYFLLFTLPLFFLTPVLAKSLPSFTQLSPPTKKAVAIKAYVGNLKPCDLDLNTREKISQTRNSSDTIREQTLNFFEKEYIKQSMHNAKLKTLTSKQETKTFPLEIEVARIDSAEPTTHIVKPKESLTKIVQSYYGYLGYFAEDSFTTYIAELNNLKNKNKLFPGQEIILPPKQQFLADTDYHNPTNVAVLQVGNRIYINKSGKYTFHFQGSDKKVKFERGHVNFKKLKSYQGIGIIQDEQGNNVSSFRISNSQEQPNYTDQFIAKKHQNSKLNSGNISLINRMRENMLYVENNFHLSDEELIEDLGFEVSINTIKRYRKDINQEKENYMRKQFALNKKLKNNYSGQMRHKYNVAQSRFS